MFEPIFLMFGTLKHEAALPSNALQCASAAIKKMIPILETPDAQRGNENGKT
jgi:hypothetical protein